MQKIFAVFVACIFGNKKFRSRKKCCSQDFMSFYRLQKNNFGQQFPYLFAPPPPKKKLLYSHSKPTFILFFSEIQNSYAEKNCCFRIQNRYNQLFKYIKKKVRFWQKIWKKLMRVVSKKIRFSQPFGVKLKIKNL